MDLLGARGGQEMHVIRCISKSFPVREPVRGHCILRYNCPCSGPRKGLIDLCLHARVLAPKIGYIKVSLPFPSVTKHLSHNSNPRHSCPTARVRTSPNNGY